VRQYLKIIGENLALGNFKVALFDAERGNCAGAIRRLKTIMGKYPDFSRIDDVYRLYGALSIATQRPQTSQENIQ
jgi:outer membrane protein assembly factor BamD (BamD/ComL family)